MQTLTDQDVILSTNDFITISHLVYEHCGINLHDGKKELVRARLAKRLRLGNFKTFPEYLEHVFNDKTGKEFSILIDSLSTNLTCFFRETQHFEFLRNRFLPSVLARNANRKCRLRAWSAGCSSGEEPYSIAMVLLEAIERHGRWDAKVLATDISTRMLETARTGRYDEGRIKPVPAPLKHKYLVPSRSHGKRLYEVAAPLKETVIFKYLNLMKSWPIQGPLDFIFCRNVMIYFDKAVQSQLVNRFWKLLDSGGILFTGHSESLTGIQHSFKYVQPTIYMKP